MVVIKIMGLAERLRINIETWDENDGKGFFDKLTQTNPNAKDDEENERSYSKFAIVDPTKKLEENWVWFLLFFSFWILPEVVRIGDVLWSRLFVLRDRGVCFSWHLLWVRFWLQQPKLRSLKRGSVDSVTQDRSWVNKSFWEIEDLCSKKINRSYIVHDCMIWWSDINWSILTNLSFLVVGRCTARLSPPTPTGMLH